MLCNWTNILVILIIVYECSSQCAEPWINEFHYDNVNADIGEFVEIAGPAGTVLDYCYEIILYNGNGGTHYHTKYLDGTIPDTECGFGVIVFNITEIQNGPNDGIALLLDPNNSGCSTQCPLNVIQFLSYEGTLIATDGKLSGQQSIDIGKMEPDNGPTGESLQLTGTGTSYSDFSWADSAAETRDAKNIQQSFCVLGGSLEGDPIIYGFDGGWFHFMGEHGNVYNIISDYHFQLNSRFISDELFKNMTWMGDLGIMVGNDVLIYNVNGTKTLNGYELVPSLMELQDGGKLSVWDEAIGIEIPNYELSFTLLSNPPHFNVHADYNPGPDSHPHGVLGQTSDGVFRFQFPKDDPRVLRSYMDHGVRICSGLHGAGCIDGDKDDYKIKSGDLLGSDFSFNVFKARKVPFKPKNWDPYQHNSRHIKYSDMSVNPDSGILGGTGDSPREPAL